jgi:hypothetical protein
MSVFLFYIYFMKKLIRKLFRKKKKGWLKEKPYVVYECRIENYEPGPFELKKLEEANRSLARMKSLPK